MEIKDTTDKALDNAKDLYEKTKLEVKRRAEMRKYHHTNIRCLSGSTQLGLKTKKAIMFQKPSGEIFFNYDDSNLYYLIDYNWSGPKYKTFVNTKGSENQVTNGKMLKTTAGAIVGHVILPGIGTLVGAGVGHSGKKKKNIEAVQSSTTETREVETSASLKFRNIDTHEVFGLQISCSTKVDSCINCFHIMDIDMSDEMVSFHPQTESNNSNTFDSFEQIKKLKELLDIGAITEDEFNTKKKELLGL